MAAGPLSLYEPAASIYMPSNNAAYQAFEPTAVLLKDLYARLKKYHGRFVLIEHGSRGARRDEFLKQTSPVLFSAADKFAALASSPA
ncbi:hypothetical protein [Atopobium deltae]|uniref:Uncharacterized protein n=1 Tax=Atopobium deltae TaxID=1393034 RepID=A0A133XXE2_9ACTN|nr:hypothetical protein [Atopobium deltae]KXB35601.1 hypothetical protein HMPREF3192_00005 [Atopobium deltae]